MGFLDSLRRVLGGQDGSSAVVYDSRLSKAWGLGSTQEGQDVEGTSSYDHVQWVKRLKRILDELPASQGEWLELMSDAKALGLKEDWILKCQTDEFLMLVRQAVSDSKFTEAEHRKLDLARDLIGIPDDEAEAALHVVVAEAEKFFGKPVEEA